MPKIRTTPYDLRAWRIKSGLTQQGAADTLCTDRRTYQRWEKAGEVPVAIMKLLLMLA